MNPKLAQTVLQFWFGELNNGMADATHRRQWFMGGECFDTAIRDRFLYTVKSALAGELVSWEASTRDRLALILVLDQFPRNIFRGDARAYAGDARARELVMDGLARAIDHELAFDERSFFYLPLEHSEHLSDQDLCVALLTEQATKAPHQQASQAAANLQWAQQHRDIIARFGRFPHRNQALDRVSTIDELTYLEHATRFGQ